MIAEVIVNHRAKSVDKAYDYAVPEELCGVIGIGSCVLVPFGRSNRHREGYVLGVKEKTSAKNLKEIIGLSKDVQVFDEKQLELIHWMREKYLVTYLDAIRVIAPSGTDVKSEEWVCLASGVKNDNEIVERLLENGGAMEINTLLASFPKSIKTRLTKLKADGVVTTEFRETQAVRDKKVRVAELLLDSEEVVEAIAALEKSNAFVQSRMLELLEDAGRLSLSDLVHISQGSYNAISALEKKGYITTFDVTVMREVLKDSEKTAEKPTLTDEQKSVLGEIKDGLLQEKYKGYLLHGVTGSGKTEVYMRTIEEVTGLGKQAIVLVPEISLTPQLVERFRSRFGKNIAIMHSGLSLGEKYDQWKRIKNGEADIVVGARSAIFAPLKNIGAIIIDEEHEQTYKSEMAPRYNTHEVAEFRAKQMGAVLLLASATPLVTDYYRAECGGYKLLEMTKRVNSRSLPEVFVVDMREELESGNRSVLSRRLRAEIEENLKKGEQTILFLNRRGFSTFVSCRKCGYVAECPNCSISMKYHKKEDLLKCHYCGYTTKNYKVCPECQSNYIRYFGGGTERVQEEIHKIFPKASTIRMDIDTTRKKNSHEEILNRFEKEKIDILIGTQMVTKGLDFPNVTLVGVISADTMLNIDDYRSGERTFSIIEQVSGRAGRSTAPGRSVIQTYTPDSSAICFAKDHKYKEFYQKELSVRRAMRYPPFCDIVSVIFSGANENVTANCAKFFAKNAFAIKEADASAQFLGPIPAYISKIKNKYIYRMIIKCENADKISEFLLAASGKCKKNANYENISIAIDKNPNSMG